MFRGTSWEAPAMFRLSDKVTIGTIGLGRQGQAITMELLARPDVQIVAVCDCNEESKNYAEYGDNALLKAARRLLGPGYDTGAKISPRRDRRNSLTISNQPGNGGPQTRASPGGSLLRLA